MSSCESGIGQLVNDEFTAKLMIDFYQFYFQTNSYTEALRQAKLKMLQDPIAANPRYWAAFVLIGE